MKKAELLKTDHHIQLKWLDNQVNKIHLDKKSFPGDVDVIERAYAKLRSPLIVDDSDLEHFMSVHLSKVGEQRLITTLRVNTKRMELGKHRLQVDLSSTNNRRLNEIVALSGKSKVEIINDLILRADYCDFEPKG